MVRLFITILVFSTLVIGCGGSSGNKSAEFLVGTWKAVFAKEGAPPSPCPVTFGDGRGCGTSDLLVLRADGSFLSETPAISSTEFGSWRRDGSLVIFRANDGTETSATIDWDGSLLVLKKAGATPFEESFVQIDI